MAIDLQRGDMGRCAAAADFPMPPAIHVLKIGANMPHVVNESCFDIEAAAFGLARFGFVELHDGRFLALAGTKGVISADRGRTWGDAYGLITGAGDPLGGTQASIIRLASGKIAIQYMMPRAARDATPESSHHETGLFFADSENEGTTWSKPRRITLPGDPGEPYHDSMIQTERGRLILPVYDNHYGGSSERIDCQSMGTVKGHRVKVAGEGHGPQLEVSHVYYSDDEGRNWCRAHNSILGWPDDGRRGTYATAEPTVAQTADGRLLMLIRSTLGRVVASWSDDDGISWSRGLPISLNSSYSPVRLRAIPGTGDLHCVWNQVTPDEIRRGYRRSRLTSAVSRDGGITWIHFKTLDCTDPLDPAPRQEPDSRIEFVVSEKECGEMPANFCIYRYPNVRYVDDTAYISYDRESFKYPGAPRRQHLLRALPIAWLYEDARNDLRLPNDVAGELAEAKCESVDD